MGSYAETSLTTSKRGQNNYETVFETVFEKRNRFRKSNEIAIFIYPL